MLELLVSFIIFFAIFFILFLFIKIEKLFKLIILVFQIFICFFLFLNIAYKKIDFWKNPEIFQEIHQTEFLPIKSIQKLVDSNGNFKNFKLEKASGFYSIIKENEYSKKCLNNYYVENSEDCPITDIILRNTQTNAYSGYIELKINNNIYIYYTKENKIDGRLYEDVSLKESNCIEENILNIDGNCYKIFFVSNFSYLDAEFINNIEEEKKNNPFQKLKNFSQYSDFLCFSILIISFIYILNQSFLNNKYNYFTIVGNILLIIPTILFIIRYIKFIQIKNFYKKHKEIFKNVLYCPKNFFNIDSILPSMCISLIIFIIMYIILPNKCHLFCKDIERLPNYKYPLDNDDGEDINRKNRIYLLFFPINLIFIVVFFLEIANDTKIKNKYKILNNGLMHNWNSNPIKSISLDSKKNYKLGHLLYKSNDKDKNFYFWKGISFLVEKMGSVNLLTSYNSKNGKICGKDNQNNNLYFPENEECPINDIYISQENKEIGGYTKLNLGPNNGFLYYTNKNTEGKILIDIKIGCNKGFQPNLEESNELCGYLREKSEIEITEECNAYEKYNNIPFYKIIDFGDACQLSNNQDYCNTIKSSKYYNYTKIELYSIYYNGINPIKKIDKEIIDNAKEKIKKYINISIAKYIFNVICIVILIYFGIILLKEEIPSSFLYVSFILLLFLLTYIIICFISIAINLKYIQNFLNVINIDFEKDKCDIIWIFLLFIFGIYFCVFDILIILYKFILKDKKICQKNNKNPEVINIIPEIVDIANTNYGPSRQTKIGEIKVKEDTLSINQRKKKEEKNENEEDEKIEKAKKECIICFEKEPEIIFVPCGHKACCEKCYDDSKKSNNPLNNCPICRKTINDILRRVYEI